MKAIIVSEGRKAGIQDVPVPSIPDNALLVKVTAVGINPTDWKHIAYGMADPGARSGCDFAGIVETPGASVTDFKKGDRVAGFVHGGNRVNHDDGAFAEYIIAKPGPLTKVPENITDEEAATLGVSITTVGQGLYKLLGLPLPSEPATKPFPVLISGGSTATGVFGIQFAKASGLTVVTTASPRNFDYLKSLGADLVVDYNSPTCVQEIIDFTGGQLEYAWDCIGAVQDICEQALGGPGKGKIGSIVNIKYPWTLGYDAIGETYEWLNGQIRHGDPGEVEFAIKFWKIARDMLEKGELKPIRQTVNRGGSGLEGVLHGLDEVRNDRVSGEKLVYTL